MINKTKLALGIATATLSMASVLVAPQAVAKQRTSEVAAMNSKVEALEAQLQAMQYELQALRAESGRPVDSADSAKVQELDQWMNSVKSEPASAKSGDKNNMVFFRGGYGHADSNRGGTTPNVGAVDTALGAGAADGVSGFSNARSGQEAWYFGAGFDFSLNDNLFGIMNGTEVFAELMFDYKQFADKMPNSLLSSTAAHNVNPAAGVAGIGSDGLATVNQLTLAASPKIKFFKGQAFRPWLIPVGFELSVVSPPSDAITVLNPGFQFGLGADYKIWQDLYVGADARYHYAPDNIDGVNTNGVTAGGYLGIGF